MQKPEQNMNRRRYLGVIGSTASLALAGCLHSNSDGPQSDPESLAEALVERIDNADADGVNELLHSDGNAEEWTAEDAVNFEDLNLEIFDISIDQNGDTATIEIVINIVDEEAENLVVEYEFRKRDGKWWVWERIDE